MAREKLESLPALDHGALHVIVKTSKGQRSKFACLAFTSQSEPMILMEQGIARAGHTGTRVSRAPSREI